MTIKEMTTLYHYERQDGGITTITAYPDGRITMLLRKRWAYSIKFLDHFEITREQLDSIGLLQKLEEVERDTGDATQV